MKTVDARTRIEWLDHDDAYGSSPLTKSDGWRCWMGTHRSSSR